MNLLADLGPWVWLIVGIAVTAAVVIYVNPKIGAAVGAVAAVAVAVAFGRRSGEKHADEVQTRRDQAHAQDVSHEAADARADSDRGNADPDKLRTSDGFKRD